ncbi:zinc finger protein 692-like [Pseudopipra pipra]|uniref:zinc finger protein 692-like n=1 Tax=Pseudopipra pipra TaxID=415032 RepID=UPI003138C305
MERGAAEEPLPVSPARGGRPRAPEVVRRQRRRELDARRSRCRIRIGGHLERWCRLKEQLGFALHSQLTQFLLDRYSNPGGTRSSAPQVPPEPSPVAAVGGSSSPEKEPGNEPREQEEQEQEKDQKEEEEEEDDLAYSGDLRDQSYHPGLGSCRRRTQGKDEEEAQIGPKRIRKAAKREILLCDFEGCGKIFSKHQYLNHHQKYQHGTCSHQCACSKCGQSPSQIIVHAAQP